VILQSLKTTPGLRINLLDVVDISLVGVLWNMQNHANVRKLALTHVFAQQEEVVQPNLEVHHQIVKTIRIMIVLNSHKLT